MTLGDKIKLLRVERGLSMERLSSISKVGKTTISEIENGKTNPTINTIKKLAIVLSVDISELTQEVNTKITFKENVASKVYVVDRLVEMGIEREKALHITDLTEEEYNSIVNERNKLLQETLYKLWRK